MVELFVWEHGICTLVVVSCMFAHQPGHGQVVCVSPHSRITQIAWFRRAYRVFGLRSCLVLQSAKVMQVAGMSTL
jgi:hypothetical protein